MLYTCIFPGHLKIAVVQPLYQEGDRSSMTNYRPISLSAVFPIVFDTAMLSVLSQHMHTNNILVTEQHGFREGISSENATFRLKESVFKSVSQKMHVGGIYCDLAKVLIT